MGGERWLMLKSSREASRLRAFLEPLEGALAVEGHPVAVGFQWHGKLRLEVAYSANVLGTEVADIVCREVCKRFGIKRIGASSVGWYPDSDWDSDHPRGAKGRYGPYTDWVTWAMEYKQTFSTFFGRDPDEGDNETWAELDSAVVAAFAKLDEAVG